MPKVKLPSVLRQLFGKRTGRVERRDQRLARIKEMGYEVQDKSGMYNGQFASRRYFLVSPCGKLLDNEGAGYASSSEAFRAVVADLEKSK